MPRKIAGSEARKDNLNMRTTKAFRAKLERAAAASGRALAHEVEHRIEQSFLDDRIRALEADVFGDEDTARLGQALRQAVGAISRSTGSNWRIDYTTREGVRTAVIGLLGRAFSGAPLDPPPAGSDEEARVKEVQELAKSVAVIFGVDALKPGALEWFASNAPMMAAMKELAEGRIEQGAGAPPAPE